MTEPTPARRTVIAREFSGGSTEESRAFLQSRLAIMALACGGITLGFLLFSTAVWLVHPRFGYGTGFFRQPAFLFHLASTVVIFGIWLSVRRGRLSEPVLTSLDWLGVGVVSLLLTLMGATMPMAEGSVHALLAVCFVLIGRAITVPSSGRRTFMVSASTSLVMVLVIVGVGSSDWARAHVSLGRVSLSERTTYTALWLVAATCQAAFASRVIFGLQQEVRDARQVGQYVLKDKIGEGGMGVVYLATHSMLRRETAIKMLLPEKVAPTALARFEREVRQLARLKHPNTVAIYDYGRTPEGVFYYAMEFLEGLDLEQLVSAVGPLPAGRVVELLAQICASLSEAHEMGLVHRDIKPANVLVSHHGGIPDAVKVLDFGLVKDIRGEGDVVLTVGDGFLGTPLYTSPEAIRNPDLVTAASDVYSVAALGYFLLTGTHLAQGRTLVEVCADHMYREPERPSIRLGKPVVPTLEDAILKGLAKEPSDRHSSAKAFAQALRGCPGVIPWTEQDAESWWASTGNTLIKKRSCLASIASQ
jgi:eukaryotic-like serine/threonine-protein kinase